MWREYLQRVSFVCLILTSMSLGQGGDYPDIGSRRELFIDHFLIDKLVNARQVLHPPVDRGEVLKFDAPWEGPFSGYVTVIKDGQTYRLYYRGHPKFGRDGDPEEVTCYAESQDGIHFDKPKLDLYEVGGTKDNNIILAGQAPVHHNFCPFLDGRSGVNPEQRFKSLGGTRTSGLMAYVSGDGIRWKKLQEKPVITKGAFDSQNVAFWSEAEQCYVSYFRIFSGGFRSISRATSKDFMHWTESREMSYGDTPREHLYTNQTHPYYRAPHIYVATAARFCPGRQVITKQQAKELQVLPHYFSDCSDAVLLTSRGGDRYERTFLEGFIRPGIGLSNWTSRCNYPALNVVETSPEEMSIYVQHEYAQPTAHLRRYTLRPDGFVSVYAPYSTGTLLTKPFRFAGKKLALNFATSAPGYIKVEIQTVAGKTISGYSLGESRELIGNFLDRAAAWKSGSDVSKLLGKPVRLKFQLKDAHLYSMQFQDK
jgi:hypothetical protein